MDKLIDDNPMTALLALLLGVVSLVGSCSMGRADAREEGFKAGIGYCTPVKE